jgi:hypothetical protein
MLTINSKMAKSSKDKGYRVFNWTLPAFRASDGTITCPMAGTCATGCYAQAGAYIWPVVSAAHQRNLDATRAPDFVRRMIDDVRTKRGQVVVRIHDSGDFYSLDYVKDWFAIMTATPEVRYYAYTKMVPMFQRLREQGVGLPANFTVIFSEGGKADAKIKTTDRHSRVFPDKASLDAAGYADASQDDTVAFGPNPKIGLIYHGAKSKSWTTS